MRQIILGIETSCDDTGIGLVDLKTGLIGHNKFSSAEIQASYGGVVPEIAARVHAEQIIRVTNQVLVEYNITVAEIVAIAYTQTPGLKGCLMVGGIFAETLGWIWNKPLIPLNHLYAHIFSVGINQPLVFPFMALVASGKTTSLYLVKALNQIELLNATVDDAIGECYDKVARVMGLNYPGGPKIDALFDPNLQPASLAQQPQAKKPFSYSGIKTAAINYWQTTNLDCDLLTRQKYLATAFQTWIIRSLVNKINFYMQAHDLNRIAIVGGVAANRFLRETLSNLNYEALLVNLEYATDNGAMIAYYGSLLYQEQEKNQKE
ncbi:N6-L-threonylcarbamoyladenine synthase [Mycoplasmoides fastidiosum]|uniref:tRNA N6-adenosine threonylcarbamoyltransferase n=1 Tax=Mycoplasmoides fastidiosum TaxID=92758 RepID=A0ABU0LYV8_9BACT|nr:tRNA (adenosine(37)-N6)-threonylcarbamoyltransferase complex transferase subunit TsaD [Mycoplasmoides fastidiosum]MDQ0513869.1 N6-L-threonylcarbamoyladenine synthase [Mycoplasmoides fastidiosum]UUD37717.1 tRNA (adenosine(37)-N6)-threonylcarbamoyltransferase complex transferase subunit TsaD [Mycoplasmoides fastidiosum]